MASPNHKTLILPRYANFEQTCICPGLVSQVSIDDFTAGWKQETLNLEKCVRSDLHRLMNNLDHETTIALPKQPKRLNIKQEDLSWICVISYFCFKQFPLLDSSTILPFISLFQSCKLNIKNERCYTKQQNNDSEPTMLKSILIYQLTVIFFSLLNTIQKNCLL